MMLFLSLLIFVSAGTFHYFAGYLFLLLLFVPMTGTILFFLRKAPDRLMKRLTGREKQREQRVAAAVLSLALPLVFILAGLDFRFGWSALPGGLVFFSSLLFLFGFWLFAEAMWENAWIFRTVEVEAGQKVVDRGLYAHIRHPLYLADLCLFLSAPLILGSFWAFLLASLICPPLLAGRSLAEERLLLQELPGYREYCKKVRYRLIPGIF